MTAGSSIQAITITGCGAFAAGLNVYIKYPLAALCKGQRRASFCRCWPLLDYPGLVAPAPPGRRHPRPVPSVGRKHTVKAGQIDSGFWHQSREVGNEIQRLKDHMGGGVPVRCFQRALEPQ